MSDNPHLLVISQVFPFPRSTGQQQRVYYKLKAFREFFHITFLSAVAETKIPDFQNQLLETCDEVILLPSLYTRSSFTRLYHWVVGRIFALWKGLKFSNYLIGHVELTPKRVSDAVKGKSFDLVLYEYWHAVNSTAVFREKGVPTYLDMHNLLWQSFSRQLDTKRLLPTPLKKRAVDKYKHQEKYAWRQFSGLIAINKAELDFARTCVPGQIPIFYAPMGTDLDLWPYSWQPTIPPRIGYYGGLGSSHNQQDAFTCYRDIMPQIWEQYPEIEFWIVGSNPPEFIRKIGEDDPRVTVTGFVKDVQTILKNFSLVLCPWSGTYGFRSRVVEVMALGVPVVASVEAVYGMDMDNEQGVLISDTIQGITEAALLLLQDNSILQNQSLFARRQIEEKYSYQNTYEKLANDLFNATTEKNLCLK